jgi:hypothetical protein
MDDSGSDLQGPVFVLAGFMSTIERWEAFNAEWEEVCSREPPTPNFHMSEAYRLKGGYWGPIFSGEETLKSRRDQRLSDLAVVIRRNALVRIQACMTWENFRDFSNLIQPEVRSPYFFLFCNIIASLCHWAKTYGNVQKIDFTFDCQSKEQLACLAAHDSLAKFLTTEAIGIISGTPIFRNDCDVLPLKAADFLAWHLRRAMSDAISARRQGIAPPEQSVALATMFELPFVIADIYRPQMQEMAELAKRNVDILPPRVFF